MKNEEIDKLEKELIKLRKQLDEKISEYDKLLEERKKLNNDLVRLSDNFVEDDEKLKGGSFRPRDELYKKFENDKGEKHDLLYECNRKIAKLKPELDSLERKYASDKDYYEYKIKGQGSYVATSFDADVVSANTPTSGYGDGVILHKDGKLYYFMWCNGTGQPKPSICPLVFGPEGSLNLKLPKETQGLENPGRYNKPGFAIEKSPNGLYYIVDKMTDEKQIVYEDALKQVKEDIGLFGKLPQYFYSKSVPAEPTAPQIPCIEKLFKEWRSSLPISFASMQDNNKKIKDVRTAISTKINEHIANLELQIEIMPDNNMYKGRLKDLKSVKERLIKEGIFAEPQAQSGTGE